MDLVTISRTLARKVDGLRFAAPITHVYNPLVYAAPLHEAYLRRYGDGPKEVLFLGMNPGPFGMTQTGVPFGDVAMVRDFLGLGDDGRTRIGKPPRENPKRPVEGLACQRSEVSGTRLWGWARDRFTTADRFHARFFVVNYCPLVFMEESGRNFTPDKLPAREKAALFAVCDEALRSVVTLLEPRHIVGVGAFAKARAQEALTGLPVAIGAILHPSPASPAANRGWAPAAEKQLNALGIALPQGKLPNVKTAPPAT